MRVMVAAAVAVGLLVVLVDEVAVVEEVVGLGDVVRVGKGC